MQIKKKIMEANLELNKCREMKLKKHEFKKMKKKQANLSEFSKYELIFQIHNL
jgi:hypothetical protein